jgi:hypothetical protein
VERLVRRPGNVVLPKAVVGMTLFRQFCQHLGTAFEAGDSRRATTKDLTQRCFDREVELRSCLATCQTVSVLYVTIAELQGLDSCAPQVASQFQTLASNLSSKTNRGKMVLPAMLLAKLAQMAGEFQIKCVMEPLLDDPPEYIHKEKVGTAREGRSAI